MKIKILLAPSMVVITIILLIWFVYPAFTDPLTGNGVVERRAELAKNKEQLATISQKSELIGTLAQNLNSSQMFSVRETVMNFLPDSIKEYEIIDNLNYLALKEGLAGTAISVSQPVASVADLSSETADAQGTTAADGAVEPAEVKPVATTFKVDFAVQGSYDKIKSVFGKIYGLKRFNRVTAMRIEPAEANKSGSDNLKATASLEFAYFKQSGSFSSIEDSVFSKTSLDTQVASAIETKKDTALLPPLQVDQKGKPNPFLP